MSTAECNDALSRAKFGRLACAHDNQAYVVPFSLAFDGGSYLYGFTTLGQKVEWMRSNPLICFEIDEVQNHNHWSSVIVSGTYEELADRPEYEISRRRAHRFLQQRAMWWETAYISQQHRDYPHSLTPIFFRIKIENVTGHRANSDHRQTGSTTPVAPLVPVRRTETRRKSELSRILRAALDYFLIVFGTGTLLGLIRTLFVIPLLGERTSELLEAPLMLLVIILTATWMVQRFQLPPWPNYRLGAGVIALGLGLLFEFGIVLTLRGLRV